MSEGNFGITEYISDHKGFFGIIKERYSDFHVNEVSETGNILYLSNRKVISAPDVVVTEPENTETFVTPPHITGDIVEELQKLSKGDTPDLKKVTIKVNDYTKEERKSIHQYIRKSFSNMESETEEKDGNKFIAVTVAGNQRKRRPRATGDSKFTHFLLYKENMDTMDAMNVLAGKLRMKTAAFAYAGMKDKRAKTTQAVSVRGVPPQNISNVANGISAITVGNFSFSKDSLCLGMLSGNHFRIVLRNIDASDELLMQAFDSIRTKGFINYYGMQRFGSGHSMTHLIGKALIQEKWKEAVDLILTPVPTDQTEMSELKKKWLETNDAKPCEGLIKPNLRFKPESKLVIGLTKRKASDYVGALSEIPRNTRLLYVHAYQSYIWNKIVSRRIRECGMKVMAGDLRPIQKEEIQKNGSSTDSNEDHQIEVKQISEDEIDGVDIADICLPLPGYAIKYPDNSIKEWYVEALAEDGLKLSSFRNKVKDYALKGSYRQVLVKPKNCAQRSCFYDDPTLPLIASDLENLNGTDVTCNHLNSGKYKAVIIEMTLPSSCYATMALRELTKMETSSSFHATLNTTTAKRSVETNEDEKPSKKKCLESIETEK